MKNQLAKFVSFVNQIDRRYLQITSFFIMLAVAVIAKAPSDGGVGPY
jgi:hypothetical protein